jgi:hypothetical protein
VAQQVNKKVLTGWDGLIHDASRQIETAKARIAVLRKTIKNLKQIRDSGQAWPREAARLP